MKLVFTKRFAIHCLLAAAFLAAVAVIFGVRDLEQVNDFAFYGVVIVALFIAAAGAPEHFGLRQPRDKNRI